MKGEEYITRVTPGIDSVLNIARNLENQIKKLKPDKACFKMVSFHTK